MEDDTLSGIKNYDSVLSSSNEIDYNPTESIDSYFEELASDKSTAASRIDVSDESKSTMISATVCKDNKMNNSKSIIKIDSFYDSIDVYYGVVDSIDADRREFTVILRPSNDENNANEINAIFDMDDIQESDKELLFVGSQLIWLIGKERKINCVKGTYKLGGITNISRMQFRRTRILNKNQKNTIEDQAHEWSHFFAGLN